jgi:protein tyrosine/serine phosphatase
MKNKKKIKGVALKLHHFVIAGVIIVAALAAYGYFLFFGTVPVNPRIAPIFVAGAAQNPDSPEVQKVLKSGKAVRMDLAGCPNLHKVSDTLYRGAQPTQEGFENLKKLGIKTVINLRDHHSDEDLLQNVELRYISIPIDTWDIKTQTVVEFLRTACDPNAAPVFVHCQHGADRTGTMVAAYRMVVQDWDASRAIMEMTHGGFGYHPLWSELPAFVRKLDVEKIKKELEKQ